MLETMSLQLKVVRRGRLLETQEHEPFRKLKVEKEQTLHCMPG